MEPNQEKKLNDLPPSTDKYWEFSDVYAREMKPVECLHYFEIVENNAQCKKCGMGLFLDDKDTIKDGHLYRDNKMII